MSAQQPPSNEPFVPPPPPLTGNPMYSREVLAAKAAEAASDAKNALIMSIIGVFCFGFILGILAYRKAESALETIAIYEVAQEKKSMATAAKIIGILDIILWVLGLIARFALS